MVKQVEEKFAGCQPREESRSGAKGDDAGGINVGCTQWLAATAVGGLTATNSC